MLCRDAAGLWPLPGAGSTESMEEPSQYRPWELPCQISALQTLIPLSIQQYPSSWPRGALGTRALGSTEPDSLAQLFQTWWAGASGLCFNILRRVFRKGMQVTGKHKESWHSASVGDTGVVLRPRVQSQTGHLCSQALRAACCLKEE